MSPGPRLRDPLLWPSPKVHKAKALQSRSCWIDWGRAGLFESVIASVLRPGRKQEVEIVTTRFGSINVQDNDIVQFRDGLVGFRGQTEFAIVPDAEVSSLVWLQSTTDEALAFAMVSPRVAVADYRVELRPGDRASIELEESLEPEVFVILNRSEHGLTVNLQGPLVFNPTRRLGRQLVLTSSRYAVRFPLGEPDAAPTLLPGPSALRASA